MTDAELGIDPKLKELVNRYNRWRRIYSYAGKSARDEPIWELGRLHLRHGYRCEGWTSIIVEPADGGYRV